MSACSLICLIGFMGCGKSTVGRLLAERLGYAFLDLDALVEERRGKSILEIFRCEGEEAFRGYETDALNSLTGRGRLVLAAGGGAAARPENSRFFLEHSFTVHLQVSFPEALARTRFDPLRPLLRLPQESLKALYDSRLPEYRRLGLTVATDGRSLEQVVEEIVRLLRARGQLREDLGQAYP